MEQTRRFGLSAFVLRTLAVVCMLLDHIGFCLPKAPFYDVFRIIGRLAFPIFVFLIVNGFRHTHSRVKYALRLFLFAIVSQVPFSLMLRSKLLYLNGNVFFTLLLSLLCVWFAAEFFRKRGWWRVLAFVPSVLVCGLYYLGVLKSDYGMKGILLALVFYFFDGHHLLTLFGSFVSLFAPTFLGYGMQLFNLLRGRGAVFALPDSWTLTGAFALSALVPIFLYNGQKGFAPKNKVAAKLLQIAFYLFYPVHMLLLWLIFKA